jgi:CTP synthase
VSGRNPELDLVEIVELRDRDFFLAVQFHPEFKSKPLTPHPIFRGFVRAAVHHLAHASQKKAHS